MDSDSSAKNTDRKRTPHRSRIPASGSAHLVDSNKEEEQMDLDVLPLGKAALPSGLIGENPAEDEEDLENRLATAQAEASARVLELVRESMPATIAHATPEIRQQWFEEQQEFSRQMEIAQEAADAHVGQFGLYYKMFYQKNSIVQKFPMRYFFLDLALANCQGNTIFQTRWECIHSNNFALMHSSSTS
ncbi:hypothetical protein DFS34DRAFT_590413 [Phlyctochytrium arcticum]|nr:hypothetical protein DFS34DRAFT_590413 [Phlyctochytrium arcticum]